MRVAIVIERLGAAGGVETVALAQIRALVRRGLQPVVVCRDADPALAQELDVRRLRVPGFWQPLRVLAFSQAAGRATRGFDVVHALSRTRHQNVYRAGGGSHAAYMEQMYPNADALARWSPRHRAILAIEEAVFADPRQIIQCNSRMVAAELRARYDVPAHRLCVIYNGVDIERYHPLRRATDGAKFRQELELRGPVALFCGTGFERKGLDRAILGLANAAVDATLLVVGGGPIEPFRELSKDLGVLDRVRFLGRRTDLAGPYAAADLFVLPTRYDPFANVCLEAFASGLPVATTTTNGAAELIDPGVNGWLGQDDFAPAFALLEDPAHLQAMGRAARQCAEGFTWDHHVDQVLALYRKAAV